MLTRRSILLTAACSVAACLTTSRFVSAGPAAADDASALAFVSAIYNSYTTGSREGVWIDSGHKLRRYFEPLLAEAMNKDQENAAKHPTSANSTRIPSSAPRISMSNTS